MSMIQVGHSPSNIDAFLIYWHWSCNDCVHTLQHITVMTSAIMTKNWRLATKNTTDQRHRVFKHFLTGETSPKQP